MRTLAARLSLFVLAALALALGGAACDSPGGDGAGGGGGGTVTPPSSGGGESFFNDFFGGQRGDDAASAPQDPCEGADCPPTPAPGGGGEATSCEQPLATNAGMTTPCASFCQKVGGCLGELGAAVNACTSDCVAALGGLEVAAATAMFGCFDELSCDDLTGDRESANNGTEAPPDARDAAPPDEGGGDVPPAEEPAPIEIEDDPLEQCYEGIMLSWAQTLAPAAKLSACIAIAERGEACGQSDVIGGGGDAPPDATPAPPPAPGVDEDLQAGCNTMAQMLTQEAFTRLSACAQLDECDAYEACMIELGQCLPFAFGVGSDATVSGGTNTSNPPEPQPTDPAPDEPGTPE